MSRILLDTSAYSAFMQGHSGLKMAVQEASRIFFTPIVLGELLAGFRKGSHVKKNERELHLFFESPRVDLLDINDETAEHYALILNALWKAGTPIPTNDIWIGACAMQHGLKILTTDRHFQKIQQVAVACFSHADQ